jgi:hypothetical protein
MDRSDSKGRACCRASTSLEFATRVANIQLGSRITLGVGTKMAPCFFFSGNLAAKIPNGNKPRVRFNRLESCTHVKNLLLFVKQKPVAAILTRAIVLSLCFFDSASAQSSEEKPEKAFWPREVKISEEVKLEQKTKYGVVTAKRIAGSVVKVVSLDSDSLRIESDGFQGTISVANTDFWDRAERTRNAAIERKKRAEELVREREEREAEEKTKAERIKRYEAATILEFEIIQVVKDGCLARVLNDNHKRIFLELTGPDLAKAAQGQTYKVRAERSGTFKYTTVLGAPSTVERWTPLAKP